LNLALVDIGAGTSDIAISSKDSISAFGMVPTAGDEVTEAIAQNFLVDFNTAERIKKECSIKDTIIYSDVLGMENEIASEDVIKVITPVTKKICEEIGSKVIELNGGKSPNAVFLVGGGAHTPKLKEILAEELNLSPQRIAIKGRDAVSECICPDNNLGSTGVTVLGIALVSIMKLGHDFIDVTLNGKVISLFNSAKHTVADVLVQAGINPKILIGKNGRNIRFNLNGVKRIAFGTLACNSQISINGILSNIDSEVKAGDSIEIDFAKDGKDAETRILDYIRDINSVGFYLNDIIIFMDPLGFINDKKVGTDEFIKEGDNVSIIFPKTLGDFKNHFEIQKGKNKYYLNNIELEDSYIICEGDRIYSKIDEAKSSEAHSYNEENEKLQNNNSQQNHESKPSSATQILQYNPLQKSGENVVEVFVNNTKVHLKNKEKYIFIDIFDFIDFDLTRPRGNLMLLLNGNKAGYYDNLANDDDIKVYWE
jgi:cell division ATPase FtsA